MPSRAFLPRREPPAPALSPRHLPAPVWDGFPELLPALSCWEVLPRRRSGCRFWCVLHMSSILFLSQFGYFLCFLVSNLMLTLFSLAGPCYAGYFCDPGSAQPDHRHCPAGFYCPEGSEFPIPCSPGSFSPVSGKGQAADCQLCPAGHSCSGEDVQGLQSEERKSPTTAPFRTALGTARAN